MDTLETFHAVTVGNHCFGQILNDLGLQELIELEVHTTYDSSVPRTSERLLLKLTTIHRLFQLLLSGKNTCEKLNDICCYLLSQNITRKLVSCLEDSNQHVVFMASKAITSLMLSVPLICTTKTQLKGVFQSCSDSDWKSLYVMNIFKQVMKGHAGDGAHNIRVPSRQSLVCHCVSSEPRVLANEKKNNVELLDFLETQEWLSILPSYVPLWEKMFRNYLDNVMAENPKCTPVDLLDYHSRLASSFHQEMIDSCFHISARSEQVFVSFITFMTEFLKFCCKVDQTDVLGARIFEKLESNQEMLLLKMVQVMPHFLHFRELSSEVWKEILKLLSISLNISTSTPNPYHYQHQAPTNNYILHSATAFIYAVNCCILDKLPQQSFFEGFGGSTVKPVTKDMGQTCQTRNPVTSVFRQASLLVVQAALVLLNSCENYRNAEPRQDILKAMNIWYGSLIKVGTSNYGDQRIYQKESGNYDKQDEEPSKTLMNTFADQDDEMIQMMLLLLQLFKVSREPAYRDVAVTLSNLNPHLIFQAFLKVIGFDHSVVLDFLISSETVFLEYLMQYLHFVLQDWEGFYQHTNSLALEDTVTTDDNKLEVKHSLDSGRQSHTSDDKTILKPADQKPSSSLTGMMACNQASAKDVSCSRSSSLGLDGLSNICSAYGSDTEDDSDDDDDGGGCDDIHAAATVNRNCYSDSRLRQVVDIDIHDIDTQESISSCDNADHTYLSSGINSYKVKNGYNTDMGSVCDDDTSHDCHDHKEEDIGDDDGNEIIRNRLQMPEKTMSTLIHTRIAAERLNQGSLFPYQVKPLINIIKKVENLYDGC